MQTGKEKEELLLADQREACTCGCCAPAAETEPARHPPRAEPACACGCVEDGCTCGCEG